MSLYALADWSMVVFGFGWTALTAGIGLAKLFVLMAKVAQLEEWAAAVSEELDTRDQRRDEVLTRSEWSA